MMDVRDSFFLSRASAEVASTRSRTSMHRKILNICINSNIQTRIPFNRATSFSRCVISLLLAASCSSNRFFSLFAKAKYVERILEPYICVRELALNIITHLLTVLRVLVSASTFALYAFPISTQRLGQTPDFSSEPSQHSGSKISK